jgi:hypothetical protein
VRATALRACRVGAGGENVLPDSVRHCSTLCMSGKVTEPAFEKKDVDRSRV